MSIVKYRKVLFNPEVSVYFQKCHPYSGNLNSETPEDSKNVYSRWENRKVPCKAIYRPGG